MSGVPHSRLHTLAHVPLLTPSLLTPTTKLVGSSINCEGAGEANPFGGLLDTGSGAAAPPWVPHVQS